MKNKYDSAVVFLYAMGKENLLPVQIRKQIPYSTICTWRKTNYSNYLGHEFRYYFDDAYKYLELQSENKKLRSAQLALARSWITLSHLILPALKKDSNKDQRGKILSAINFLRTTWGLDKTLKLFGLSKPLFYQWELEARFSCFDSYTQLCAKRHPQQLSIQEILKIKSILNDPLTDHWPINSLQAEALRKNELVASLYSWYKYANMWGIKRKLTKKHQKTIGIIAKFPNEYLHIDTTFYPLMDGQKICISFTMDNFSKMILGYHVAENNTFDIVRNSLRKALKIIAQHPGQKESLLVTDGGKENHNKTIDEFIRKLTKQKIKKVRALKDIRFSNSPVEAIHRIMKGRYLKNRQFESIKALNNYLKWAVNDYNKIRPHYKHKHLTPYEAYFNIPLKFDVRTRVKQAIVDRVKTNKCVGCVQCSGCNFKKKCTKTC